MQFSQRIGRTPAAKLVQREAMDDELRNSLWSVLTLMHWDTCDSKVSNYRSGSGLVKGSSMEPLIGRIWLLHLKQPIDTVDRYWDNCLLELRDHFFGLDWYRVFDFIELVADYGPEDKKKPFEDMCNFFLERENSAYRFLNGKIVEISSQEEIEEVEDAVAKSTPYFGVKTHLSAALSHLSNRTDPDYRNSIKESISAVESLAKQICGDSSATLGALLSTLEKSH